MKQNTSEKLKRFIGLLEGIFELDKVDLNFGIYRIINIRKDEIKQFLSEDLPKKVQDALATFAADTGKIKERIAAIEKQAAELGIEITASPKLAEEYARLKSQLAAGTDLSSLETDVYSALYSFFNRYYDEGDFISKRRYKEGVYAIPYEGEEVKLYWANADQYYIKTAENFRDYSFIDGGKKIHFRTVDATTEKNNNKESDTTKREFMLYKEMPDRPELKTIEEIDGELIIRFVYDVPADKKVKYAEENLKTLYDVILKQFKYWQHLLASASGAKKENRTVLQKHLTAYVAKNTFDYFIHKNLRGFLTRELDFFIKSEVVHLDDIDTTDEKRADSYLAKVRAIKRVGKIIIDFLAQIEDFQKKLWLKKKFVVSTNWCVTIDRVGEAFYSEIIANAAQLAEWRGMYAIHEIQGNPTTVGYSEPLTADFLRQNGNLVLDTRHFTVDFKDRLIASIDNLDEQTGGLLIHSENFQALRFLAQKYRGRIDGIYIDPPYNTDASKILYKNNYEHSSWLSLMNERLILGKSLIKHNGMQATAIDDYELRELYSLLIETFQRENNAGIIAIRSNPSGRPRTGGLALSHEYTFISKVSSDSAVPKFERSKEQASRYDKSDNDGVYEQRNFRREGSNSNREDGIRQWYPIFVDRNTLALRVSDMIWDDDTGLWNILEPATENEETIYPINDDGLEKNWRWSWENVKKDYSQFYALRQSSGIQVYYKFRPNIEGITPLTFWDDKKYSAVEYGTKLLKKYFPSSPFPYPKSVYAVEDILKVLNISLNKTVLDYFAGSGTTGHAVLNLNRSDEGNRKYIIVEMGEYFYAVTLPRMKKVIYSTDWEDGKPENRNTGFSHIMKSITLESYEDTLSNIELDDEKHRLLALMGEDYMLRYMFNYEAKDSMLSLDAFNAPFVYQLKINEHNETKSKTVDICETFNYLLGMSVIRQSTETRFSASPDSKGKYENAVKLEPDDSGEYGFKQIEGRLADGKRALVIWRTVTKDLLQSNTALDAYFDKHRINPTDREFDVIYVNGDNNLQNLRLDDESWKVQRIEPVFKEKMFEEAE